MKTKILIIGSMPPPITGEGTANELVKNNLDTSNFSIDAIDTNLLNNYVLDAGYFRISKFLKQMVIYSKSYKIFLNDLIYIIPGKSYFGLLRFLPLVLISKIAKKQLVFHVHGGLFSQVMNKNKISKFLFKKVYQNPSCAIALSPSLKSCYEGLVKEDRIFFLPNFVEENLLISKWYLDKKTQDILIKKKLNLLFLSNLMPEKGYCELLQALTILDSKIVDFRIHIAGFADPEAHRNINKFKDIFGENLSYHGVVHGNEKARLLREADIFILPTTHPTEGQPITILEAMASGCFVITSIQGGIPDVIKQNKNGYLMPDCTPATIAEHIYDVFKKRALVAKVMMTNHNEAKSKYRAQNFIENLEKIFISASK